jgi:TrmH family RNA methyltransferase
VVSKSQIKFIKSLNLQKFRQKYDKFTAEGEKTVTEFIKHKKYPLEQVLCDSSTLFDYFSRLVPAEKLTLVTRSEMEQISMFKTPSHIMAVFEKKEPDWDVSDIVGQKTLYLDDIQDPGNLGTMIRIADWFGLKNVIRSSGSADFYHPKVIQSTMGSLCNVRLKTMALSEIAGLSVKIPVIGALLEGESLSQNHQLPGSGILVIGNEGHGIKAENIGFITHPFRISGHQNKIAESLNAASACSIFCFEWSTVGQ